MRRCWASGGAGGAAHVIVERDDGYINASDACEYFTRPDDWPLTDRTACDRATGRILDVGCGAGRHATVLRQRGLDVTGLEPSPAAAAVAVERGVPTIVASIEQPPAGLGRYDTLLLLGNNLGLLGGARTAPAVLAALARLAAPGARVLAAGTDPYGTRDPDHLAYHERNRRLGRFPGQLRIRVRDGRTCTDWFDYLLPSRAELETVVADSPWRLVCTGPADGAAYLATLGLRSDPSP